MSKDVIEPHEAAGDLEVIAVRYADARDDSIGVATLRWRDAGSGRIGESTRARLVLGIERGQRMFVEHAGAPIPVEVAPAADGGGAILRAMAGATDLILALPRF